MFRVLQQLGGPAWMDLDLSMAQLKTMFLLSHEAPTSVGHVAEALGIGLPAASHLVEKLVQSEIATRADDPADRRRTLIRLTSEGERIVERLRTGSDEHLRGWLGQLPRNELEALARGLELLAQVAEAEMIHPQGKSRQGCPILTLCQRTRSRRIDKSAASARDASTSSAQVLTIPRKRNTRFGQP